MFIKIGEQEHEAKTKLGVAVQLEKKFKMTLTELLNKVGTANVTELVDVIKISAGKNNDAIFEDSILENWDYTDLQTAVQELLLRLMFSGDQEEVNKKLNKFPAGEEEKNAIRELLGLPKKNTSARPALSKQLTESE